MPARNVAETLEKTVAEIPEAFREHLLLGDNASSDETVPIAERLGIRVLRHGQDVGYGGNLKRLYRQALRDGARIVVELHPDFQYDPRVVDLLAAYVERSYFDLIQGNRIRSRDEAMAGGMPVWRHLGNRLLTFEENLWFGLNLGEWHSGMKAFRAKVLEALPLERYPDTYAFNTTTS